MRQVAVLVSVGFVLGCGKPAPAAPPQATLIRAAEGGRIGRPGSIQIEVPMSALKEDASLEITEEPREKFPGGRVVGPIWNVRVKGEDHHRFNHPVKVAVPYDPSLLPTGARVDLAFWNGTRWQRYEDGSFHPLLRVVRARVAHFSPVAPLAADDAVQTVGRYSGRTRSSRRFPSVEPIGRRLWGYSSFTHVSEISWSAREEFSERLGLSRVITESAAYRITEGAKWYEPPPGKPRLLAQEPLDVGSNWAEGELKGPRPPEDEQKLAELKEKLASLRAQLDQLKAQYDQAAPDDRDAIQRRYEPVQRDFTRKEEDILRLEFSPHPQLAQASVSHERDANGDIVSTSLICGISADTRYTRTTYILKQLSAAGGWGTSPYTSEKSLIIQSGKLKCPPWVNVQSDSGIERIDECHGTGEIPDGDREVTVRGTVLHRVRIPKSETDDNLIKGALGWADGAAVPVAGARVEAWLTDASASWRPSGLPDRVIRTSADGSFSIPMLLLPKHAIVLQVVWENDEAKIEERQWLGVAVDDIRAVTLDEGQAHALGGLTRAGAAKVRYAMNRKELDLGSESRGATLRRKNGALQLDFEKGESLLVNTFVLRTPYLNQNTQKTPVKVDVPTRPLLDICPPARLEETRRRLNAEAADGTTEVVFEGYVVCFPTCCTMALQSLGYAATVKELAQGAYDDEKANDGDPAAPPWWLPFLDLLMAQFEAYRAALATFGGAPSQAAFNAVMEAAAAVLNNSTAFGAHWPYVAADSYTRKEWLATLADGDNRPWQVVQGMKRFLLAKYAPSLEIVERDRDVFANDSAPKVLNRLGAGCPALVSIDHLSRRGVGRGRYAPRKGGHILVLVGAICRADGSIARLIFNDPFGDLTQHPDQNGYYDPRWLTGAMAGMYNGDCDADETGTRGAYAPYATPDVKSYDDRIYGKYWVVFRMKDEPATPEKLQARLLSADAR